MKYWILILLLQDPTHQWHALRAAAYSTNKDCLDQGAKIKKSLGEANNYFCLEADYPN